MQTLDELLKTTDSLTYINALKVTLTEVKSELAELEKLREYMEIHFDKLRKLQRKADNQYRLIAKLVSKEAPVVTGITVVEDNIDNYDELKELMEDG